MSHQRGASPGVLAALAMAVLAACQTPVADKPAAPAAKEAPQPAAAAPAPAPAAPVSPSEPPAPPSTLNVPRLVALSIELLESGNEEQASIELQRALQVDPGHRLAQNLMRQITADPFTTLGRESFPYRVQPGETLSRIAGRFLGDVYSFYLLARYNDIKVPRQLAGGQLIRIPGKAPPPATAPPPAVPPPDAAPPAAAGPRPPPGPSPAEVARIEREKAERERNQAIARFTRAARAAFARQDLNAAIQQWDQVLELDPGNATARLERQRAVELKERLGKVK